MRAYGLLVIDECGEAVLDEPGDRGTAPGSVTPQRLVLLRAELDLELTHDSVRLHPAGEVQRDGVPGVASSVLTVRTRTIPRRLRPRSCRRRTRRTRACRRAG